ncbi:methyltransferase family protein [Nocardiopsis coralliicola]
MALTALLLYLAALLLAFGLRSLVAWRRTGDTGFRWPDAPLFSTEWWGARMFIVAALLAAAAPAAALAGVPPLAPVLPAVGWGGIALMAAGLALVLASQAAMGDSWRIGVDDSEQTGLVTGGIFGIVRNPIFTGLGMLLAGMVAAVPSALSVAALAICIASVQIQVRVVEEPYLLRTHPDDYRAYAQRTGRFLPGLGRLSGPASD